MCGGEVSSMDVLFACVVFQLEQEVPETPLILITIYPQCPCLIRYLGKELKLGLRRLGHSS